MRYSPIPGGDSLTEFAVLDVTITGRSSVSFHYSGEAFVFQYSDGADPYRPDDTRMWGADPADGAAFPPRLGSGDLGSGQVAHGTVPLRVDPGSRLLVEMLDAGTSVLAQWLVVSATAP